MRLRPPDNVSSADPARIDVYHPIASTSDIVSPSMIAARAVEEERHALQRPSYAGYMLW